MPDLTGAARPLREWLDRGPVLIAFFKISCPTCQYTFPFLQRLAGSAAPVVGICQDVRRKAEGFNREFGITFPVLLDSEDKNYPVSNAYGITHVPSLFLIEPDARVTLASTGFARTDLEEIAQRFGVAELFHRDEKIEAFRAG